jgi:hypothetical protein
MKKTKTASVLELATKIKPLIGAVSDQLNDTVFRNEFYVVLQRDDECEPLLQILRTALNALPDELVKAYIFTLPGRPHPAVGELEGVSNPLKEIAALLHPHALGEWVKIPEELGCRMKDV